MDENIRNFINLFNKIKNKNFNKALRKGYTGIGFTYEALLGKKEDNSYNPDFNGIEIKTKLGYSKSNMTLFTLVPQSENGIRHLYEKYAYKRFHSQGGKSFRCDIYGNQKILIQNKYILNLKIDRLNKRIILLIISSSLEEVDDSVYWEFDFIKKRLETKLNTLAVIKGYPYKKNNKQNYKYTSLSIYKLKNFECFLKMIEEGKIYITFNIGTHINQSRYGQIYDRGTAFKIKNEYLDLLFEKIY